MEYKKVESSNIAEVGYDPATQTLEVIFKNGRIYEYAGVDQQKSAVCICRKYSADIRPHAVVSAESIAGCYYERPFSEIGEDQGRVISDDI